MSVRHGAATAVAADAERFRAAHARRREHSSWASPAFLIAIQDCEHHMLELFKRYGYIPLAEKSILEVGCGTGGWIRQFVRWGARPERVTGIDLLAGPVAESW